MTDTTTQTGSIIATGVTMPDGSTYNHFAFNPDAPAHTAPLYVRAFPEFATAQMPLMPAHWRDQSWQNDTCPRFIVCEVKALASSVSVWVEHSDPAQREYADDTGGRYVLQRQFADGDHVDILQADDWDSILRFAQIEEVAAAFAQELLLALDPHEWAAMRAANTINRDTNVCASHDHCDANIHMAEAILRVTGKPALDLDRESGMSDDTLALWNAAWDAAKTAYLTAPEGSTEAMWDAWRATGHDVQSIERHCEGCGVVGPGRVYESGYIELSEAGTDCEPFVVNAGNTSQDFSDLPDAERWLWDAHAKAEIMYDYHRPTPTTEGAKAGWTAPVLETFTPRANRFRVALEAAHGALIREGSPAAASAIAAILAQTGCETFDPAAVTLTDLISVIIDG